MGRRPLSLTLVAAIAVTASFLAISHEAVLLTGQGGGSTGGFTLLTTQPDAALQPTAWGKTVQSLAVWNGHLYAGYGDYNANTGPINIRPYDLATNKWLGVQTSDLTEEIDNYKLITVNGVTDLYANSVDPRGAHSTDYASGQVSNGVESWTQNQMWSGGAFQHAFDMATLTGSDLWEVGSYVPADYPGTTTPNTKAASYATAFRGTVVNGALQWQLQTDALVGPDLTTCSICDVRYYGAGVYNGKLYLQAENAETGMAPFAEVFDGSMWTKLSPSPFTGLLGYAHEFAGKLVYLEISGQIFAGPLYAFDGTKSASVSPASFSSFAIDGTTLYGLSGGSKHSGGGVYATTDLVHWTKILSAPSGANSITAAGGKLYVGTASSQIFVAPE